ncbi:unnamed protein product [Orchesella dallaii]|uniref:Alpha-2-macroglobulin receptor-associated protein n=1 Tax=Orchesella dallaii TaxID=48710 RepID=A0ABP1Q551_9HEXA
MKTSSSSFLMLCLFLTLIHVTLQNENRYSKEANVNYRELDKPFRMAKMNMVWHKAKQKVSETKLRSLYTDLLAQDKEESTLKRLKSDGLDKDGLKEASVRKKFKALLQNYGLVHYFEEDEVPEKSHKTEQNPSDNHINKSIFKDKKLNKLWEKAEKSGFDQKELKTLKEEFEHYQDKIDEYYSLLETLNVDDKKNLHLQPLSDLEHFDHLEKSDEPSKKYPDGGHPVVNDIRTKHRGLKDEYDSLHRKVASGRDSKEFSEPRVAGLWRMAMNADFTQEELDSLRTELKHYEKRLEKLQHLQSEFIVKQDHDKNYMSTDKDMNSLFAEKIKRHERHVEKLHVDLETKISNRHNEL